MTADNVYINCGSYYEIKVAYKDNFCTTYISAEDFPRVSAVHWRTNHKRNNKAYIIGNVNSKPIYLHNFILNYTRANGYEVDHINGNSLDNRRENLEIVSRQENIDNSRVHIDNKIGIRGISYDETNKRYVCDFVNHGVRVYFRNFETLAEAVYCRLIVELVCGIGIALNNPLTEQYISQLSQDQKDELRSYAINRYCECNGI